MKVSAIIPTYNEEKYISKCLESLDQQSLKPTEVIVVDDGSTDKTLKVLPELRITNYELRILRQKHKGAGSSRNLGAKKARGDTLVFVDADMEFDKNFIKELIAPIIEKKTKGTFSKNEFVANWNNPWARSWNYCIGIKDKRIVPKNHPNNSPVFRAILKSEHKKVGGFDENRGYDDDWSLSEKLGYKATIAKGAKYFHHNPETLNEFFYQARWRGIRKYKLNYIGKLFTLLKTILLSLSFLGPLHTAIKYQYLKSFVAKFIYDIGIATGIASNILTGKSHK